MSEPGAIILLNGPSSAGKSTLAIQLQNDLPLPFFFYSFDHFLDSSALPKSRLQSGEFDWADLRESFFDGLYRTIPVLAEAGNNLVVEQIVESEAWMARLLRLVGHLDVFFVGLHCPLEELEKREQARGNRRIGDAKRDFETTHQFCQYDLEVDSTQDPAENSARIIDAWLSRSKPTAFDRMASR